MVKSVTTSWGINSADPRDALKEYRWMLNDLTRLISDWVWETDVDFRLTYVSDKIFENLGIAPDLAIGKKLTQFGTFKSSTGGMIHPDFSMPFRDLAFEAENREGKVRHILVSGLPVYDPSSGEYIGVRGISRDVTDEKATRKDSEKLNFAIDNYPGHFFLTNSDDRLIIANQKFREFNQDAQNGSDLGTLFEEHVRAIVEKGLVLDAIGKEEEWITYRMYFHRNPHGSFEIRRQGGVVVQVSEFKLDDGSTATFSTDISEIKQVEAALRKSVEHNRIFAMNVGHDLRTPLAVLTANIDNMSDKKMAASLRLDVNIMRRSVEQLLDATKWDMAKIGEHDVVDLSKITHDVVSELALSAIMSGRDLQLQGAENPVLVSGLEEPISTAFRNLIENAIKYGPENTDIVVEVEPSGAVMIMDMGPGISDQIKENLAVPHIRIDRRGPNSGRGLSIVQSIAEAHGTTLEFLDKKGGGTIFRLAFTLIDD